MVKLLDILSYKGDKEEDRLRFLKSRLMELYAPTESESYARMIQVPMLQPRQKPSVLFANLRALHPHDMDNTDDSFFFKMMLPRNIQGLLQAQGRRPA